MQDVLILHIGGQCGIAAVMRNQYNFTDLALPFDYVRTTLKCIINNIENNFENYVPTRERCDYIHDTIKLFIEDDHAFYNHDITLDSIKDSLKRRCDRFMNILINNDKLILVRVITSKNMSDEINLANDLYDSIKKINKNIDLQIVFIGHRNDTDFLNIYYKKINNNCVLFTCGYKFRLEEFYPNVYKNCIDFVIQNGFKNEQLIINLDTLEYKIDNNILVNDVNFYFLDNYYDILPKKVKNHELIIDDEKFNEMYPNFNISVFKMYNKDFELFDNVEIQNYLYLYGNDKNIMTICIPLICLK